jgi:hypothetical protein
MGDLIGTVGGFGSFVMRAVLIVLALAVAALAPATAAVKPGKEKAPAAFSRSEEVLKWINGYRLKPEPKRLPQAVRAMSDFGLIRDMDQAGVYIGFTAGVLGSEADSIDKAITALFPLGPEDQVLLIKAIAYSGLPDWKQVLTRYVERMPARKVLIDKYLFGGKPSLEDLPLHEDQSAIDINWGYYFATGAEAPVRRIVKAMAMSTDKDDVEKLTIGSMAKWTLAQNAAHDADLLAMLKQLPEDEAAAVRQPLNEVIDAAETLELSKVRRQALASIEELKAKGPEKVRAYNWWGQAGQTVLALGCVAAGALGQVEFGIPCVVGGALSSAALKYLGPSQ